MGLLLFGCSDYNLTGKDEHGGDDSMPSTGDSTPNESEPPTDLSCPEPDFPVETVAANDACGTTIGSFTPVVEWEVLNLGGSLSLPQVADLNGDAIPEIIINICSSSWYSNCHLHAFSGDGSGEIASAPVEIGYGTGAAIADLDDDGVPEVVTVSGTSSYKVVALDNNLQVLWQSQAFTSGEMDYSTYPAISDMDHDGSPEIVAGRVILDAMGNVRGIGPKGRGSWDYSGFQEGAMSFPADVDLDGTEEVVTGNALYDPNGNIIAQNNLLDAIPAVGNFDSDPEAEIVWSARNQLALLDTNMQPIWGPITFNNVNIMSPPAVGDLDVDGDAEIVIAIGASIYAFRGDGSELWRASIQDSSGATGPSIFDFEGDGIPEVVYADEIQLLGLNGPDGTVKFNSQRHDSPTMYDTPTIADVDNDGHAEIVVSHYGMSTGQISGFSVYGDQNDSWMGTRPLWNQHAYSITNINDDLSVPETATPNWTIYNNFHAAIPTTAAGPDVNPAFLDVCTEDCDGGWLQVTTRLENRGSEVVPAGTMLALYAENGGSTTLIATRTLSDDVEPLNSSEQMVFYVETSALSAGDRLYLVADDDGTGAGTIAECDEVNNSVVWGGATCE